MMRDDVREVATLAAASVLVLASATGLLRRLQPRRLLSRLQTLLRSALERLGSSGGAGADEVDLLVQARLRQLKVDHTQWCFQALCAFVTLMTAFGIRNIALGLLRMQSPRQDAVFLLMHGLLALVLNCPSVLSWKTLDIFISALMLLMAAYTSPWACGPEVVVETVVTVTAVTILLNTVRRSVLMSAVFNSVLAVAVMASFIAHRGQTVSLSRNLVSMVLAILVLFPAFACKVDASICVDIRKSLERQVAREALMAASALLRSCCDVVVELDREGVILGPAQDLEAFLLRGPGRRLEGSHLWQLFPLEEDRGKLLGKLSAPEPSSTGLAEATHVQLKDGNDELLRMELLCFGFHHMDGTRRFMVGLRHFSDFSPKETSRPHRRQPCAEHGEGNGSGNSSEASEPDRQPCAGHGEGSEPDRQPLSEASEGRAASSSSTPLEIQAARLTVDATREGLPVQDFSPGFRSRIGRLQRGSTFVGYLAGRTDDFVEWVQVGLNTAFAGGEVPDRQVTLDMDQGRLTATCKLVLESGVEPTLHRLEIAFSDVRAGSGRSSRRCRSGSGASNRLKGTPVGHARL